MQTVWNPAMGWHERPDGSIKTVLYSGRLVNVDMALPAERQISLAAQRWKKEHERLYGRR